MNVKAYDEIHNFPGEEAEEKFFEDHDEYGDDEQTIQSEETPEVASSSPKCCYCVVGSTLCNLSRMLKRAGQKFISGWRCGSEVSRRLNAAKAEHRNFSDFYLK